MSNSSVRMKWKVGKKPVRSSMFSSTCFKNVSKKKQSFLWKRVELISPRTRVQREKSNGRNNFKVKAIDVTRIAQMFSLARETEPPAMTCGCPFLSLLFVHIF